MNLEKPLKKLKAELKEINKQKRDIDYMFAIGQITQEEIKELNYKKDILEVRIEGIERLIKGMDKKVVTKAVEHAKSVIEERYKNNG